MVNDQNGLAVHCSAVVHYTHGAVVQNNVVIVYTGGVVVSYSEVVVDTTGAVDGLDGAELHCNAVIYETEC